MLHASASPCKHRDVRRQWKTLLLAGCGLIAVVAICFFCLREKQPSYNGRTLSAWLEEYNPTWQYDRAGNRRNVPTRTEQSILAVEAIGTNAVPLLLRWAAAKDSSILNVLGTVFEKLPERVVMFIAPTIWSGTAGRKNMLAKSGFDILGTNAVAAVPELKRMFNNTSPGLDLEVPAFCLKCVGRAGFQVLAEAVENNQSNAQYFAASKQLAQITPGDPNTAPVAETCVRILQSNKSNNLDARCIGISILGSLALDPQRFIPIITNQFNTTNTRIRRVVVESLWKYGTNASLALPTVREALNDGDANVRAVAQSVLPFIEGTPINSGRTNHVLQF